MTLASESTRVFLALLIAFTASACSSGTEKPRSSEGKDSAAMADMPGMPGMKSD